MCDYSLHEVASRPARLGDKLMTTAFAGTCTRGFCAVGERNVAVCLQPGTELAFKEEAVEESLLGRLLPTSRFGKLGDKVARFRQINKRDLNTHHDALEFAKRQNYSVDASSCWPARHRPPASAGIAFCQRGA